MAEFFFFPFGIDAVYSELGGIIFFNWSIVDLQCFKLQQTDDEAEALIFWSPGMKNWLIGKDPDAGKDWGQEEKGTAEDETVGWHHWLDGYEFKQAPGVADRQGTLVCCNPWGRKESGMTEWPNWEQMWTSL